LLAQSAGPAQTPVFRSSVELVRIDIRVIDDDGKPIVDLRPEELEITEEGTRRPVLLFQHVSAPQTTYVEAARRTIAAQVSTNEGAPLGHVYVLVFDESHILPGHEQRARVAAERFLRTHVRPGDRVALYALPGPGPQIEFTADVARVIRELRMVRGGGEDSATTPIGPMRTFDAYEIARGNQQTLERVTTSIAESRLAGDVRPATVNRPNPATETEDPAAVRRAVAENARTFVARADADSRRVLVGLADIVKTLRAVDGRKAVILFSEGFQIDNVTHELEDVAAAAAQSYSVVYAMDLNVHTVEASDEAPRGGERMTEIRDRLQSLGSLAGETGGTLVNDAASQLDRALARIAETTEDYYLVGFTPAKTEPADRNRYRRIHVSVTRAGARVSARTGYTSNPTATPADRRRAIDAALRAPFSKQELRVEYTTYIMRGTAPDMQRVIVSLAAELPVASGGGTTADVVYVVRDTETGKVAASGSDRIPLPTAPAAGHGGSGAGLYRVQFELPSGTYIMRAVVREPGGLVGSADRRFQVRALNRPDVTASDLVLGSADVAGLPVRASAYDSDVLDGVFEVYGRTDAQLENLTATADLVPLDGTADVLSSRAELEPIRIGADGARRGVRVELPLAGVRPGDYLVRATVRGGGETVAELLRDVTVKAGARPAATVRAAPFDPQDVLRGDVVRRYVETIQAGSSDSSVEAIRRGMSAFARADYAAAIAEIQAAQRAGANDAPLAFVLGWAHAAAGDDAAAITAWRNAALIDPSLVASYLALIDTYMRLGHSELARQVTTSGLRAVPGSPELMEWLARLNEKR
jgi:VWFA-related protein